MGLLTGNSREEFLKAPGMRLQAQLVEDHGTRSALAAEVAEAREAAKRTQAGTLREAKCMQECSRPLSLLGASLLRSLLSHSSGACLCSHSWPRR